MDNPYETPDANTELSSSPKSFGWMGLSLLTGFTIAVHMSLHWLSYGYDRLFQGFGADLPVLTTIFLPNSVVYFLLPGVCIFSITGKLWSWQAPRMVFIVCAALSLVLIPLFFIAMYQPIFKMGSVV